METQRFPKAHLNPELKQGWLVGKFPNKIFVVAGEHYAIFDIEELFVPMGREPEICRRVNKSAVVTPTAGDCPSMIN
jgi:hypothetical protein